eukprot:CAMPEP_0175086604 /NCGR_PEP_ID=MMETSP0052_2-20121109/29347_1 /TAXON_ID=51329 ORGANISM="Polytomella parva, Strain SAG 63-3" /NCGR_SAMPLE_ID=MMETSP0052_2 /ASSEMBLY_ACC=CAM_ASM_000194 /LENGTH=94 /DNA_ID=CAMNT_0016358817 /DNA_START=210 /DNA_END=490 /DNA_ORIENTATION=-
MDAPRGSWLAVDSEDLRILDSWWPANCRRKLFAPAIRLLGDNWFELVMLLLFGWLFKKLVVDETVGVVTAPEDATATPGIGDMPAPPPPELTPA